MKETAELSEGNLPRTNAIEAHRCSVELTVVIPTFNERENISTLIRCLEAALDGIGWEVIFVDDDSPDGTADFVRKIAQRNPRVRLIRRIGRRGLASACVEGVMSSSAEYFAVMDADMQHNEAILPQMIHQLKEEGLDIVVGSRYIQAGSTEGWDKKRQTISRIANLAARVVLKVHLSDPMSGFFLMRRQSFDEIVHQLSLQGFKILLDLFASAPRPLRFAEVPFQFGLRKHGESKFDSMAAWEFGMLLTDKLFGRAVPPRFMLFAAVGGSGLFVHIMALAMALNAGLAFEISQAIAVIIAMTSNFILNNLITYRDRRLSGWQFVRGLLSFYLVCSVGAVANIGVAVLIYAEQPIWWLAGVAGAAVGAVWNYAVSAFFTWR